MSLAFYALATAFVMLALTFAAGARAPLGSAAVGFLLLAGVGAANGGIFPVDPPGRSKPISAGRDSFRAWDS
jgi:hypothetical protein